MALADDDDGFAGRFDPSDDLLHIVIPDDLRELDAEVVAYRRELEAARKTERRQRRLRRFTPKWARSGMPSPVFTVVLLLIATTGLMLSVFAPVTRPAPSQLPVSAEPLARPTLQAPAVGALLADAKLESGPSLANPNGPIDYLNPHDPAVRPAVFVLLPPGCDCSDVIRQIVGQANEPQPPVQVVLVSAGTDTSAFQLVAGRNSGLIGVRDPASTLATLYHANAKLTTLLLVRGDGTLAQAPLPFASGDRIDTDLLQLRN